MNPKLKFRIEKVFMLSIMITLNLLKGWSVNGNPENEIPKDVSMPIGFIENKGQWPANVLFLFQSNNANHWITKEGLVSDYFIDEFKLSNIAGINDSYYRKGHVLKYVFNTQNNVLNYEAYKPIPDLSYSYFIGNDKSKWVSEAKLYKEVLIKNMYNHIDVKWYFDEKNNLRYDFIVKTQGNISDIKIDIEGGNLLYDELSNKIILETSLGNIEHSDLNTFDELNNKLYSNFLVSDNTIQINVKRSHANDKIITIDPVIYSTFYGNNSGLRYDDGTYSSTVTPASFYILGYTGATSYPSTAGAYSSSNSGGISNSEIIVVRLNASNGAILKATFIGGTNGYDIFSYNGKIRADNGKVYIAARTTSDDYPTTSTALFTTDPYVNYTNGWNAIFSVFDANLSSLKYSTYYEADNFNGLDLIQGGGVVLGANHLWSTTTITTGAYDNTHNGYIDMGIIVLLPDINTTDPDDYYLAYSTFLGGIDHDELQHLKVVGTKLYICGFTYSNDYPMQNAYDNSLGGGKDAFITVFDLTVLPTPSLNLYYSSYFGTAEDEEFMHLSVNGNVVYAVGYTKGYDSGVNSPFTTAQLNTSNTQQNLLAVSVDVSQTTPTSQMLYRIYFPGNYNDYAYGCYYENGKLYVCGETTSPDFYVTQNAYDCSFNSLGVNSSSYTGNSDIILLTIEQASPTSTAQINYSTFYGGTNWDNALDVIVINSNVHLLGFTASNNFPLHNYSDNAFTSVVNKPFVVKLTFPEQIPVITTSYSPTHLCEPANVTLNASSSISNIVNNYLWNNSVSGASNSISNLMAGTHIYTVTTTLNSGCKLTNTVSFVVNQNPNVNIVATPNPVCEGAILSFQVSSPGNTINIYQWSGPSSFSSNMPNPTRNNVMLNHAGVYTVTTTNNYNCVKTATVSITVNPKPLISLSYNTNVCEASPLTIYASSNPSTVSYSWTGPNSYSSNNPNVNIGSAQLNQGGIYTVTVSDNNTNCSAIATASITVNPLPVITVTNNTPICQGGNVSLAATATNAASYTWIYPDATILNNNTLTINNAQPTHSGIYTVTVVSPHQCITATTTSVVVHPNPVINPSSNSPVCEGLTLNLYANGSGSGINYSWTGPMGFTANGNSTSINNVQLGHTGTYIVTATDQQTACSSTGNVNVAINPLPVLTPTSNSPVCENETLQLNVNSVPNGNYTWNGPNISGMNQQNFSINPVSLSDGGTYTVSVVDMNGCSVSATTSVIINALPTIQVLSNSPVCEEGTLNLFALSNSSNATFIWTGPHSFSSLNQNPSISDISIFHNGQFIVSVTDGNTQCSNSSSVNVVVNPLPQATITTLPDQLTKCEKESVMLSVVQDSIAVSYQWAGPGSATYSNRNWYISNLNANQTGTYTVTVTSNQGCTRSNSTQLVVHPKPLALYVVDKPAGCSEHCMKFTDLSSVSGSATINGWDWRYEGANFSNAQNPNLCITNNGSIAKKYDVQLIVTSSDGCKDTLLMNDMIEVFPLPATDFSTEKYNYTLIDNILFRDESVGNQNLMGWNWDMGDGTVYTQSNITHSYADTGSYTVTLTTTNNYGCTSSVSYVYYINEVFTFFIPNSFTPNRDMKNDVWNIKGRGIKEFKMEVYNRWGERIYETDDYTLGWPGTYKTSSEKVQAGTYTYKIYVFDINNEEHNYIGHVNVIY